MELAEPLEHCLTLALLAQMDMLAQGRHVLLALALALVVAPALASASIVQHETISSVSGPAKRIVAPAADGPGYRVHQQAQRQVGTEIDVAAFTLVATTLQTEKSNNSMFQMDAFHPNVFRHHIAYQDWISAECSAMDSETGRWFIISGRDHALHVYDSMNGFKEIGQPIPARRGVVDCAYDPYDDAVLFVAVYHVGGYYRMDTKTGEVTKLREFNWAVTLGSGAYDYISQVYYLGIDRSDGTGDRLVAFNTRTRELIHDWPVSSVLTAPGFVERHNQLVGYVYRVGIVTVDVDTGVMVTLVPQNQLCKGEKVCFASEYAGAVDQYRMRYTLQLSHYEHNLLATIDLTLGRVVHAEEVYGTTLRFMEWRPVRQSDPGVDGHGDDADDDVATALL